MNVVRQFSGALTLGWVPDGLIPKYHFDTELHILCYSHTVVDIVQLRTLLLKVLVLSRRIFVLFTITQPTRRNTKGAQHTRSFPGRPWHSDSHIPLPHQGCVHTSRVGADYINLQALSG